MVEKQIPRGGWCLRQFSAILPSLRLRYIRIQGMAHAFQILKYLLPIDFFIKTTGNGHS